MSVPGRSPAAPGGRGRDAVLGIRSPSPVEKAASTWAHDPDFAGRLAAALVGFPGGDSYARMIAVAAAGQG